MSALPSKAHIPQHCLDIRFGPEADISQHPADVRFAPESGHWRHPNLIGIENHIESLLGELEDARKNATDLRRPTKSGIWQTRSL